MTSGSGAHVCRAVAFVVCLAASVASPAGSTPPGRDGLIAYVSHGWGVKGVYGIVVIRADGHGARPVTRNYRDSSPSWSPDGSKLVFTRAGRLFVIRLDGTGLRSIAPRLNRAAQPSWSPDGRSIAFVRGRTLYVMRATGGAVRRVFERDNAFVSSPSWSPDGNSLAFAVFDEEGLSGSIAIVKSTGGDSRDVVSEESLDGVNPPDFDLNDYEPDWSPDGARIASSLYDRIFTVNVDGSGIRWFTRFSGNSASRPAWSPRGDRIVAETTEGLAVVTAAGRLLRVLDGLGTEPAWQSLR